MLKLKNKNFNQHKSFISMKNIDINNEVSNKVSFGKKGFKYFIGYKDTKKVRLLFIFFPKM